MDETFIKAKEKKTKKSNMVLFFLVSQNWGQQFSLGMLWGLSVQPVASLGLAGWRETV